MADPQHLKWLKEDAEAWNGLLGGPDFIPDLSDADLEAFDFGYLNLREAVFFGSRLKYAVFANANLTGADFSGMPDLPNTGTILISIADQDESEITDFVEGIDILHRVGFRYLATRGTEKYLRQHAVPATPVYTVLEGRPHVVDAIEDGEVDLVFNTALGAQAISDSFSLRRSARQHRIPLFTTNSSISLAIRLLVHSAELHEYDHLRHWADRFFRPKILGPADLRHAVFDKANCEGTIFTGALLQGAKLDLAENLTQEQLNGAFGDSNTTLPLGLERPAHWPPAVPESEPGPAFAQDAEGQITVVASGSISDGDLADTSELLGQIEQALKTVRDSLHSDAYHAISHNVSTYLNVLEQKPLSIDALYAQGMLLEQATHRVRQEIDQGEIPEMDPTAGAALDTALTCHGVVIASTERGRTLLERASTYAGEKTDVVGLKAAATRLAEQIGESKDLATRDSRDLIKEVNEGIDEGPHPDRSTALALVTNRNFLIVAASAAISTVGATAGSAVLSGMEASVPVAELTKQTTTAVNAIWEFFPKNVGVLKQYAAVAGPDMAWLTNFVDWVTRQVENVKGQVASKK